MAGACGSTSSTPGTFGYGPQGRVTLPSPWSTDLTAVPRSFKKCKIEVYRASTLASSRLVARSNKFIPEAYVDRASVQVLSFFLGYAGELQFGVGRLQHRSSAIVFSSFKEMVADVGLKLAAKPGRRVLRRLGCKGATMRRHKGCPYGPTNDYLLSSPIGQLLVKSCPHGLHGLNQVEGINDSTFAPDESAEVKLLSQEFEDNGYTYRPVLSCLSWLDGYFRTWAGSLSFPRHPNVTSQARREVRGRHSGSFQGLVWRTLVEAAGPGTTLSYGQLAALCGNPGASRAVGSALRRNPLQLVVPCHRVVRGDGSPGHYSGGSRDRVKHWLLSHEGCPCPVTRR
ncbi:hypothetical protein HPB47_006407 [Ixodes persulcatus]|uniref:Uncharacterized protein n=1 Tax=Ixodes persulcatus TaxID=34615 RepID=A0AC60PA73_IXOPE|nr:hypothetical protein HPB47_006407 [Ixodes persulcatus]